MEIIKTILVADNSPLYRHGMRIVLTEGQMKYDLSEADSCDAVMNSLEQNLDLDLIILDVALLKPGLDCPLKGLIARMPKQVLLLCDQITSDTLRQACSLGIHNMVSKKDTLGDLNRGVQTVLDGKRCWPTQQTVDVTTHENRVNTYEFQERLSDLTCKQKTVLNYLSHGMKNKQIGSKMGIGEATVKFHISNLFGMLQVRNRTQLVLTMQRVKEMGGYSRPA